MRARRRRAIGARGASLCDDGTPVEAEHASSEEKLAELVLYVAEQLRDDAPGGATKLNKVLYFAEFRHMRRFGKPITGVSYRKLPQGPAPRRFRPVRDELIGSGAARLEVDDYFGVPLHRLIPIRPANRSLFTDDELATVDQVVKALWGKSASDVSELSHQEVGWRILDMNEDIPYASAYLPPRFAVTQRMRDHAQALAARLQEQ